MEKKKPREVHDPVKGHEKNEIVGTEFLIEILTNTVSVPHTIYTN